MKSVENFRNELNKAVELVKSEIASKPLTITSSEEVTSTIEKCVDKLVTLLDEMHIALHMSASDTVALHQEVYDALFTIRAEYALDCKLASI